MRYNPYWLAFLCAGLVLSTGCLEEASNGATEPALCGDASTRCDVPEGDMSSDLPDDTTGGQDSGSTPVVMRDMAMTPDQQSAPPADMNTDPPEPTCADVNSCQGGDGCCPASCDATSDTDCQVDCRDFDSWPANWAAEEEKLVELINVERSKGANCGSKGSFAPAPAVTMSRTLQIASRCHSVDMVGRGGLDHTGTDGSSFSQRARREGYSGAPRGENIAAGNQTAERTLGQWMGSDGHCANIMKPDIDRIGTGYFTGNVRFTHYWTMVTGKGGQ